MRPGVPVGEVDRIRHAAVSRSPFGGTPSERTGYAIGIGFAPGWGESRLMSLQASERRPLAAGMTFHVSTFIQIPGEAGIGLTETVVVTERGGEPLTSYARRLFVAQGS
jgi:Xaa-Pro dipeptidase